jgi:hypothetical protein
MIKKRNNYIVNYNKTFFIYVVNFNPTKIKHGLINYLFSN